MDSETELVTGPSGRVHPVPILRTTFQPWAGAAVPNYGGKAVIDSGGTPLFAELGALERFRTDGRVGVWVDSFRRKYRDAMPPAAIELPAQRRAPLERIRGKSGPRGGAWDM